MKNILIINETYLTYMKKKSSQYLMTIFLAITMMMSISTPTSARTIDLIVPQLEVEEYNYDLNEDHDIYIVNEQFHQLVDETFDFSPATMSQRNFFEDSNNHPNQFEGVTQYLNNSLVTPDQKLEYKRNYYNLFANGTEDVGNIFLESDRTYLFTYDVSDENLSPMFFEFLFTQVSLGTVFDLDIVVVDPLGNSDNIKKLKTTKEVTQLVPFIPNTNGSHIFGITTNRNVVLAVMTLNLEPDIVDITTGYSDHLQGDITEGKFFFLDSENRSKIIDLNSLIYQKEYYIDQNNIITFGNIVTYLFGRETTGLFGGGTPLPNEDVYMALIVSPSDPADVLVQKAKTDGVYDKGIDIELTIVSQSTPISPLPVNENFNTDIIDSYSKDNGERVYSYETSETILIGVNSSTANPNAQLRFVSNDPDVGQIIASPAKNDVLNDNTDDFVQIPAGVYTVFVPAVQKYLITILAFDTLDIGQTLTLSTTFEDTHYFELPSGEFTSDFFNFTYLDMKNESVSFDYTLYDEFGGMIKSNTIDFAHYYYDSSGNPNNIVWDTIIFNQTSVLGEINFRGAYLKLEITANEKWNSETGELQYQDNVTITSQIRITRLNSFKIAQQTDLKNLYYFDELLTSISHSFKNGNDTVINYFELLTKANSVYRITIDITNRTIEDFDVDLGNNLWYENMQQLNPENISNYNHYILSVEFLTTIPVNIGMILLLGDQTIDGTYTITLEEYSFEEFGVITLPGLNITDFSEILAGGSILANPVFWGLLLGGIGIFAAITIFLKKSGRI